MQGSLLLAAEITCLFPLLGVCPPCPALKEKKKKGVLKAPTNSAVNCGIKDAEGGDPTRLWFIQQRPISVAHPESRAISGSSLPYFSFRNA